MNHLGKLLFLPVLFLVSCGDNPSSSGDGVVPATEAWHLVVPGANNYADIDMKKGGDGAVTCTGKWYYEFFGSTVTCTIMHGTVQKNGTVYTINCNGTAAYPPDEDGYIESSAFTMQMTGTFSNGSAAGDWAISFTDEEWNAWAPDPGQFDATRKSGSGVTE